MFRYPIYSVQGMVYGSLRPRSTPASGYPTRRALRCQDDAPQPTAVGVLCHATAVAGSPPLRPSHGVPRSGIVTCARRWPAPELARARTRRTTMAATPCTHLDQIQDVTPSADGCE